MLVPLRELLSWERHTNFRFRSLVSITTAVSVLMYLSTSPDRSAFLWSSQCAHRLKQCVSYGVARSWFLPRFVFSVEWRFVPITSSSPSPSASSPTAILIWAPRSPSWAPPCWRGVVSGSTVEQIVPGAGAGAVHARSCPAVASSIQWVCTVGPGNVSRPGGWRVSPASCTALIAAAKSAAAALAGARRAGLGSRWWIPVWPLLSNWWQSDDATLYGGIIEGRDHTGRTGGKWDGRRHMLVRRWDLLHVVWWRWRDLMETNTGNKQYSVVEK